MFKKILCSSLALMLLICSFSIVSINATDNNISWGTSIYSSSRANLIPKGYWDEDVSFYETSINWSVAYKVGDANLDGKINIKDTSIIQANIAKIRAFSIDALFSADTDNNGVINITDATAIQKYIAGIELSDEFSIGVNENFGISSSTSHTTGAVSSYSSSMPSK